MKSPPTRPVVLTGFMGAGKTTIGPLLASRLRLPFVDLDRAIELEFGLAVSEIFAIKGEREFRRREAELFLHLLQAEPAVIATGGGTLENESLLVPALESAFVIWLDAPDDVLIGRILGDPSRPLARLGACGLRAIKRRRIPFYSRAHARIWTEGLSPMDIAERIRVMIDDLNPGLEKLRNILREPPGRSFSSRLVVPLGERSYSIQFRPGGRKELGVLLRRVCGNIERAVVITNALVGSHYYSQVSTSLEAEGIEALRINVPDGEEAKSLNQAQEVLERMISHRIERREPVIALGGGVVGDLAGFVASICLRGIPFIQVPTTVLAQVDSSVGGKTGVNSAKGKNLIGSFYQPRHVLVDVEVLRTLDVREVGAGLAEVVKYGAIRDPVFLDFIEDNMTGIIDRDLHIFEQLIYRSCANKAEIVGLDERESGCRALLNFGHTLAHVLETLGDYRALRHGEAVAVGMIFAARLSRARGLCSPDVEHRLKRLLGALGLPVTPPPLQVDPCLEIMSRDKKVRHGKVSFVVLDALGKARLEPLSLEEIRPVLADFLDHAP